MSEPTTSTDHAAVDATVNSPADTTLPPSPSVANDPGMATFPIDPAGDASPSALSDPGAGTSERPTAQPVSAEPDDSTDAESAAHPESEADGDESPGQTPDQTLGQAPDDSAADLAERYARLAARCESLTDELAALQVRLTDGDRERTLDRLAAEVAVDLETERARCLVGRGSPMTDDAFTRHVEAIRLYARPVPTGRYLPRGVAAAESLSPDDEAAVASRAVAIAEARRRAGRPTDWRTAWESALAERA